MDDRVLDYHDILLRVRDVALLRGPQWLNDQVLSFYFAHLQNDGRSPADVAFVDASMSFLLGNLSPTEVSSVLASTKVSSASVILALVNDECDVKRVDGGSHWSLLVFRKGIGWSHYDSSQTGGSRANKANANTLAAALAPYVRSGDGDGGVVNHKPPDAPTQVNGYDCGAYALATAEAVRDAHVEVTRSHRSGSRDSGCGDAYDERLRARLRDITPEYVAEFRRGILSLIEELAEDDLSI